MTPKSPPNDPDLFRSRLDNILNMDHELCQLADKIDWERIEAELADCYSADMGRPGRAGDPQLYATRFHATNLLRNGK